MCARRRARAVPADQGRVPRARRRRSPIYAAFTGGPALARADAARRARARASRSRVALLWRLVLRARGRRRRGTRGSSPSAPTTGPFVVALRAMFGMERGITLRQNLANAFIVNWLWLPTLLALVDARAGVAAAGAGALPARDRADRRARGDVHLDDADVPDLHGPALRDAADAAHAADRPGRAAAVAAAARGRSCSARCCSRSLLGAWSPTDPVSRKLFGTVSVGGERIYDTAQLRAAARIARCYNFAALRATRAHERAAAAGVRDRRRRW